MQTVALPEGDAVVVAHQVPADSVVVRMNSGGSVMSCSRAAVCGARHAYEAREPDQAVGNRARVRRRRVPVEPGDGSETS